MDAVVDAMLRASRVLVAIAARSLVGVDADVTLAQYRTLVVLASRGPQSGRTLAGALAVHTSTITRMCDRLVAKRLITRRESTDDRREVTLACTARGKNLVDQVTHRRRAEMAAVVQRVPRAQRAAVIEALNAFGDAANEPPEAAWAQGWGLK